MYSYIVAWFWFVVWVWLWWQPNCREQFRCLAIGSWIYSTWWPKPDITALRTYSEVIRSASFMSFELCNVALVDPSRSVRKEEGGGNSAKVEGSRHCRRAAQAGGGTATMLGRSWGTARRCKTGTEVIWMPSRPSEMKRINNVFYFKDNLNIITWNKLLYIYLCPGYSKREFDAIVFLVCVCVCVCVCVVWTLSWERMALFVHVVLEQNTWPMDAQKKCLRALFRTRRRSEYPLVN